MRCYEAKQYKKAIKAADAVLKRFPDHGETLAMKGLTLYYMGEARRAEAHELAKRGLRCDLRSHVCWHVYGLLHRGDNNYPEAVKAYLNALRLDKDNVQILRDLASLQIHLRDVPGFVESRHRLLTLRPSARANWIAFAVGHHLDGNHELAAQILTAYESTLEEVPAGEAFEHSEMLLYKAQVLAEGGRPAAALALLQAKKGAIKDALGAALQEAALHLELGAAGEAEAIYRRLLALNPDDYRLHRGLQAALGLLPAADGGADSGSGKQNGGNNSSSSSRNSGSGSGSSSGSGSGGLAPSGVYTPEQRARLKDLYAALAAEHPKSPAVQRIPLDFTEGADFLAAADAFCRRYVVRGIPSLFSAVRPLYADPAKAAALGKLMESYEAALRSGGALPPRLDGQPDGSASGRRSGVEREDGSGSSGGAGAAAAAANGSSSAGGAGGGGSSSTGGGGGGGGALRPIELTDAQRRADEQERDQLAWVLHFKAQHLGHLGDAAGALAASDEALARAPDVVELHSARAALLAASGDAGGAAHHAEAARGRDLADRYLNSLAVAALFAAGRSAEAERAAALFTRDGDQATNLFDMQHMWYECAAGEAALRAGRHGPALKSLTAVAKHFGDISEDQFDFHSYCLRKMTLRAYVALLRMEDELYGHAFFVRVR